MGTARPARLSGPTARASSTTSATGPSSSPPASTTASAGAGASTACPSSAPTTSTSAPAAHTRMSPTRSASTTRPSSTSFTGSYVEDVLIERFASRLKAAPPHRRGPPVSWHDLHSLGWARSSLHLKCCDLFHHGSRDPRDKSDDFFRILREMKDL